MAGPEGQGGQNALPQTHDLLYQSLTRWLDSADLHMGSDGPVFRSFERGDHVTTKSLDASAIERLVAAYGSEAGIAAERGPNQLSPHDLRRTCTQAMLGHEDPKTTAHYIGAFEADGDTAVDYVRY